jgi:archaetidylinositol phosphate synthase
MKNMVLDSKRDTVDPVLSFVAHRFKSLPANVISWLAFVFSVAAGFFFYISSPENELLSYYLFFASFFIFLNGLFDAVDGKIAKLTKTTSDKGDFLDHALDRYADVFIVGGLALSAWCDIKIGFFAIIGMLLTSYMGTQAQAVGYKRVYAGLLGRADRLVLLMITPILQHILLRTDIARPFGFSLLEWCMIYIAIVGNLTSVQRFVQTLRFFSSKNDKN